MNLLCSSEDALLTHTELFSSFICKLNLCITLFVELTCIFLHIFIRAAVLHFQLKEVPDDFFVDIVSRNNFLTVTLQVIRTTRVHVYYYYTKGKLSNINLKCTMCDHVGLYNHPFLQTFFSSLESSNDRIDKNLVRRGLQFRESLTKRYKWDFSSEPDEYAPTLVDT